jgi:hypothetical protein
MDQQGSGHWPSQLSTPILSFSTSLQVGTPYPAALLVHSFPVNIFRVNELTGAFRRVIRIVDIFF